MVNIFQSEPGNRGNLERLATKQSPKPSRHFPAQKKSQRQRRQKISLRNPRGVRHVQLPRQMAKRMVRPLTAKDAPAKKNWTRNPRQRARRKRKKLRNRRQNIPANPWPMCRQRKGPLNRDVMKHRQRQQQAKLFVCTSFHYSAASA